MTLRFDEFELDPSARELRRAGARVSLQPKAFDLLLHLVRNRDRVVPRRELLDAVWPGVHVTGASVGRALKSMRKALGDDPALARFVLTLPKRGWRFVARVADSADSHPAAYVGRAALLARLRSLLTDLAEGQGRVVLLVGPAGIGKTRTASELLGWARSRGMAVASAASGASGANQLSQWEGLARSLRLEVARTTVDDRVARFAALWEGFERASEARPLALLIDDLQEAHEDEIALLSFAAHGMRRAPVLVVATLRAEEAALRPSAARALDRLRRAPNVEEILLAPLTSDEIATLVFALRGWTLSGALAGFVAERVAGNPLYLGEALRAAGPVRPETPSEWDALLLDGISRVLANRVAVLAPPDVTILRAAAVIGDLNSRIVGAAAESGEDDTNAAVERAIAAGIVAPAGSGELRFSHPLFAEVLAASVTGAHKQALHLRAAAAIESAGGEAATRRVAQHLLDAGPRGNPARAIEFALRAGASAERSHAFDRAAALYERAVVLLEAAHADRATEARLWTRLAEARRRAGSSGAEAAAQRALDCARGVDAERVVEATLAFAGVMDRQRLPRPEIERALVAALAQLGDSAHAARSRLLARLAAERAFAPDRDQNAALRAEALEAARNAADIALELQVVDTPFAGIFENLSPAERYALADRAVEHARAVGRAGMLVRARVVRVGELLSRGELAETEAELSRVEREATAAHDLSSLYVATLYRSTLALAHGDAPDALRLATEAHALARRLGLGGGAFFRTQRAAVAIAQGRAREGLESLAEAAEREPGPAGRALLAWALAESGEHARCRRLLQEVGARDAAELRRFPLFVANAAVLARACARVGAGELASELAAILAPQRGRIAVRGLVASHGPATHALALCAIARGDRERAAEFWREAREQAERAGAPGWVAEIEASRRDFGTG